MTSSESGEDFESADEDFDCDSVTKNTNDELTSINKKNVELDDESNNKLSEEAQSDQITAGLKNLNLEINLINEPNLISNDQPSKENQSRTQSLEGEALQSPINLDNKSDSLSSKLQKSNEAEVKVKHNDDLRDVAGNQEVDKRTLQTSSIPDNLQSSLQKNVETSPESNSTDGWDIEEIEDVKEIVSLDDPVKSEIISKVNDDLNVIQKVNEDETFHKVAMIDEIQSKEEVSTEANVKDKSDGWDDDGWEIEEEDGFEIPALLAKSADGSIQCAQEQICEMDQVQFKPSKTQEQGWGGWGGWGVGSLLSTATGSVTVLSSHVSAGLSTVLESAVGAPNPEVLAAAAVSVEHCEPKQENSLVEEEKTPSGFGGFGSLVSGVSYLGNSVISRGLDTLETLGKKTMEVLQEGDPGLKKKRAMLFPNQDKPVLSQILREAKEKADNSDREKEEKETARKVHFESLFDDFQGMVHLEALEMLSTQCDLKLQSLVLSETGAQLEDLQETMAQVRELCEMPDDDEDSEDLSPEEFADKVTKFVKGLNVNFSASKIIKVNNEVVSRLQELNSESTTGVNEAAISSLAQFTAAAMECFHKSAELLLAKQQRKTHEEADSYIQLTSHLCARVSAMANEFTQLLTKHDPIANSSTITNIFLEASNSCSYMKNACQLLVPILQVGAICS